MSVLRPDESIARLFGLNFDVIFFTYPVFNAEDLMGPQTVSRNKTEGDLPRTVCNRINKVFDRGIRRNLTRIDCLLSD